MAISVTCPDCEATFVAFNQWLASIAFDAHECEKHKPVILSICPILQYMNKEEQRSLSMVSTMEIFDQIKKDASNAKQTFSLSIAFDDELWMHLEARLKYLLNHAGLR